MPITIDEVVEKGKQRKQLLTLAEKQEISDQARGIGQQGQWEELIQDSMQILNCRMCLRMVT